MFSSAHSVRESSLHLPFLSGSSRPSAGEFLNIRGPLNLELGMSAPGPLSNSFVYSLDLFINSAFSSY